MRTKILSTLILLILCSLIFSVAKGIIVVESKSCVGCTDCQNVCPVKAIEIVDGKAVIDQEKCIKCEICVKSCTYDAIRKFK